MVAEGFVDNCLGIVIAPGHVIRALPFLDVAFDKAVSRGFGTAACRGKYAEFLLPGLFICSLEGLFVCLGSGKRIFSQTRSQHDAVD